MPIPLTPAACSGLLSFKLILMDVKDRLYFIFRRKTNTLSFIPQIDGLRFVAIAMVVLYHVNIFVTNKVPFDFTRPAPDYWWMFQFLDSDRKGVLLFFVISGFILALPFARAARKEGKPVEMKRYFLRRLTRLEPPYFLTMIASYLGIILLKGHGFAELLNRTFTGLFPSLAVSLVYMHNVIFPHNLSVNPVAWSLEIEIQFYILMPLLAVVFKFTARTRWLLLATVMAGFIFFQHLLQPGVYTLFNYIQYFLLGFLLVDVYLSNYKPKLFPGASIIIGILCLAFIGYADLRQFNYQEYVFVPVIFIFYVLALTDGFWKRVFSFRLLTVIGGMCYSIYLLHYNIIAVVGNRTIFFNVTQNYPLAYLWHAAILLPIILLVSGVFYLLIERPCMDKDWPKKLWQYVNRLVGRNVAEQPGI